MIDRFSFASLRFLPVLALATILAHVDGYGQPHSPGSNRAEFERSADPEVAAEGRYDLARDEERGGHTLQRHIGRTDGQLNERLMLEPNISAASTWTDRPSAEETVARALRAQRDRVQGWMRRGFPRANLALHFDAGHVIGRSLRRGDKEPVPCTGAVIVLRADREEGFYVLTAYPEVRE